MSLWYRLLPLRPHNEVPDASTKVGSSGHVSAGCKDNTCWNYNHQPLLQYIEILRYIVNIHIYILPYECLSTNDGHRMMAFFMAEPSWPIIAISTRGCTAATTSSFGGCTCTNRWSQFHWSSLAGAVFLSLMLCGWQGCMIFHDIRYIEYCKYKISIEL